jgi:hypothetical protein
MSGLRFSDQDVSHGGFFGSRRIAGFSEGNHFFRAEQMPMP